MRVEQPVGRRGSLKWIQNFVNIRPDLLSNEILPTLDGAGGIEWLSPLIADNYAEYRDRAFLDRIGQDHLSHELSRFWPQRGPQWDALGRTPAGDVLLVEAKAHIPELCSPGSAASAKSRDMISAALRETASICGAVPKAPWTDVFYQLCNRLAHLHFLRTRGVKAWLVLVNFIHDDDMQGPRASAEWDAAYQVAYHVLGLNVRAQLFRNVIHVYPDVRALS